jgi:hypothetical protein
MRLWPLLLFGACVPSTMLSVESSTPFPSDLAVGAEVFATGMHFDEGTAPINIDELVVSPDERATARRITDQKFAIQMLTSGPLHIHAVIEGDDNDINFDVVPATIGPMRVGTQPGYLEALPPVVSPRPTEIGVFAPSHVFFEEPIVDDAGQPLTGHPIEPWAPQDRLLPVKSQESPPRTQFELTPDATPVAVSVGGETISFVTVAANTATRFVLVDPKTGTIYDGTTAIPAPIVTPYYNTTYLIVLAYDAHDRLLVGEDVTATAASTTIDSVTGGQSLVIYANAPGTSSLNVTYDGLTVMFPVIVP